MVDMRWLLGGETMPKFTTFEEMVMPNAGEMITLDGTLNVDVINVRRGWRVKYELITRENYNILRAKYDQQFTDTIMHYVTIPSENVYAKVYMKINDKNIRYNGTLIEGIEVELLEQFGIS